MGERKKCLMCEETKKVEDFRLTYIKTVGKYYIRSHCKKCQNKLRNIQHSAEKYREWRNARWRKQYHAKKSNPFQSKIIIKLI